MPAHRVLGLTLTCVPLIRTARRLWLSVSSLSRR
jgi:hypothetical protein